MEDMMKHEHPAATRDYSVWLTQDDCRIDDLRALVERATEPGDYPFASAIVENLPVYEARAVRSAADHPRSRLDLMAEWVKAMTSGPGVVVFKGAFDDMAALDRVSGHFRDMIAEEKAEGTGGGDLFAKPGANDRVWNALEKLCLRDPESFAAYYGNDLLALVCEAWLGPGYQVTSQVNSVNPGGAAQSAHRDYHLGFQTPAQIERYPVHVHRLSPMLTLQGAVAHCDMPTETGPTLYLPYSQAYLPGYLATGLPAFKDYFAANHVQLPLEKGDAAFFNPALFHAAGPNRTSDIHRLANLLQVSSAYGRAMESVDRARMSRALYPVLARRLIEGRMGRAAASRAIAACAEGYSFPTNLDRDPPIGGLAPETQQALFLRALSEGWEPHTFGSALERQSLNRLT
jgi:ectoine hydroxylase-related dioxygenase (phytanoyl-CoA dioxygenase family)